MQKKDIFQTWQQQKMAVLLHNIIAEASIAREYVGELEECNLVLPEGQSNLNYLKKVLADGIDVLVAKFGELQQFRFLAAG